MSRRDGCCFVISAYVSTLLLLVASFAECFTFGNSPPEVRCISLDAASSYDDDGSDNKTILVVGATGKLGSRIVQDLSERNIPYRCLVRPTSPMLDSLQSQIKDSADAEIFEGDLASVQDVQRAVKDIRGCIVVSGSFRKRRLSDIFGVSKRWIAKDTSHPFVVNHIGMQNLCQAIKDSDMKIVKVSGVLLSLPSWHYIPLVGNFLYSGVLRWHKAGEQTITESGINFTVLRPGSFRGDDHADVARPRRLVVSEHGALKPRIKVDKPCVGLDDLAKLCIDCLESKDETDGKILYPSWEFFDDNTT